MAPVANTSRRLRVNLPAEAQVVHVIRAQFEQFVAPVPYTPEEVEALKVALSEACSNAIRHGSPLGRANRIRVECWLEDDQLIIEVEDEGGQLPGELVKRGRSSDWRTSGRGLHLIREFTDSVEFLPRHPGLLVRMAKRLPLNSGQPANAVRHDVYHARA